MACRYEEEVFREEGQVSECGCPSCPYKNLDGCREEVMSEEKLGVAEDLRPDCKLIGRDGNVFAIIGAVQRVLKQKGMREKAEEWVERATHSHSYDEVLAMLHEYVNVR